MTSRRMLPDLLLAGLLLSPIVVGLVVMGATSRRKPEPVRRRLSDDELIRLHPWLAKRMGKMQ